MTAAHIHLTPLVSTLALVIASHGTARLCAEDRPAGAAGDVYEERLITGTYQATGSVSVLDDPLPALGHRLTLSYAPPVIGGSFDARVEYYVDGYYNDSPPGQLDHNINVPKYEGHPRVGGLIIT